MQRIETITTKIRPIKKMFVIDQNDHDSFNQLFIKIQEDVDIVYNLFFVNDDYLWTDYTYEFVKRSDPDIIINFSTIDDKVLSSHFGVFTVKPFTDQYKIERFCTQLISFQNKPAFFENFNFDENEELLLLSANKLENTAESLFTCINFGLADDETLEYTDITIFKKMKFQRINNLDTALNSLFSKDKYINFLLPIIDYASTGNGHSIYDIEFNQDSLFSDKKRYYFISKFDDFKSISFFWNIRSYYAYSNLAWIPDKLLTELMSIINNDDVFVCFIESISKNVSDLYPNNKILLLDRLYFHTQNNRWRFFEHTQTVNIIDNKLKIFHPYEKSFGSIGAFVLEVSGLKEFLLPKFGKIGELFSYRSHPGFDERFNRISSKGLAKYYLSFDPLHQFIRDDFYDVILLPNFTDIVKYIFLKANFDYNDTAKSSILNQTFNIFGDFDNLKIISNKIIFDLLLSLTPMVRTEKLINKISDSDIKKEEIYSTITSIRDEGGLEIPNVILNLNDLLSKTPKEDKDKYTEIYQNLHNKNILLRGKSFKCPYCNSKVWIQINAIKTKNKCPDCNNKINIPIDGCDYFKLNHLIIRAIDQGQLTTLLLLYYFYKQNYYFDFVSNIEIRKNNETITDIDLFIKIGRRIGIIESKSKSGFEQKQIDELLETAKELKCDFVGLSTLLDSNDQSITDIFNYLKEKPNKIPIFIITGDVLFNPKSDMISHFFEPFYFNNKYPTGPLLVCKLPSDYHFYRNLNNIVQTI